MGVTLEKMPEVTNSLAGLRKCFVIIQPLPPKLSVNIHEPTTDAICVLKHITFLLYAKGKS